MLALEQLTLNGAVTLLTCLQYARLAKDEAISAAAVAATLCEMLNQLDSRHPGITSDYGWGKINPTDSILSSPSVDYLFLEDDCYSSFNAASLS